MELQIGDILKFDYYKTLDPVYILIEDIDDSMPGDEIIHFRSLNTNETHMRFIHTLLDEQPTKVA